MNTTDFSSMKLSELKEFAALAGVTLPSGARKAEIIAFLNEKQRQAEQEARIDPDIPVKSEDIKDESLNQAVTEMLSSGDCGDCCGVLDILPDGYGFLRCGPFEFAKKGIKKDVYVSIAQIRRFNLRTGDKVSGKTRPLREGEKYAALLYVLSINDLRPDVAAHRRRFESLTPIYPDRRLTLEGGGNDISLRLIDLIAPIGKG